MTASTDIILHLVKKTTLIQVVGFCLITAGESYSAAGERIRKLIVREMNESTQ